MLNVEVLSDELMLGANIVVKGNEGKGVGIGGVRGGRRLTVAKESRDDDEELWACQMNSISTIGFGTSPSLGSESCPPLSARHCRILLIASQNERGRCDVAMLYLPNTKSDIQ